MKNNPNEAQKLLTELQKACQESEAEREVVRQKIREMAKRMSEQAAIDEFFKYYCPRARF